MPVFLVPQGAEAQAVRRAVPHATVVAIRAGRRSADLPAAIPAGTIVVLGLCGGLRGVQTGDVAILQDAVDEIGRYTFDAELVRTLHAALPSAALVHGCAVDHVVTRAAERVALAAAYGADTVDMESTYVARALAARGRAALVARVVSDDPRFDLPPIEDAFDADGALRPLHLARAFAARPAAAARFIRDVQRALRVLGATAATLATYGFC